MPSFRAFACTAGAALIAGAAGCTPTLPDTASATAPVRVNLTRFAGRWHVIAGSSRFVDGGEVGNTVEFRHRDDGGLDELRRAHPGTFDRPETTDATVLHPLDPPSYARWKTEAIWPFSRERRVLYVSGDYRFVLMGDAGSGQAEILAREPEVPEWIYIGLLARLVEQHYDVTGLRRVPQRPADIGRPGFR